MALAVSHLPSLLLLDASDSDDAFSPFPSPPPSNRSSPSSASAFRPGIAVIVGVLTIMFSLTFLLLLYAKHCKRAAAGYGGGGGFAGSGFPSSAVERRHSGVERAVVDSLPVFRFGSLRGQKEGLECAVCLNRFEPAEALRLLPKCRHAFHVECVDTWLDAHSTCPLCRVRVDPEDVLLVPHPEPEPQGGGEKRSESKGGGGNGGAEGAPKGIPLPFVRRMSGRHSSAGEKSSNSLQIVVHRAADSAESRECRRSTDCTGCTLNTAPAAAPKVRKDGLLPTAAAESEDREAFERRYSHRIVVSGPGGGGREGQERWSDLHPSDLLFLRSEMIITESGRFSSSKLGRASRSSSASAGRGTGRGRGGAASRCTSEIVGTSRFPTGGRSAASGAAEERAMGRWLGFAPKRSASWLGGRRESGN